MATGFIGNCHQFSVARLLSMPPGQGNRATTSAFDFSFAACLLAMQGIVFEYAGDWFASKLAPTETASAAENKNRYK
ncbi:hypothetical protein P5705_18860 [Pseudomonas entomophila]|uniref:hypothetical protein n=1 Tax=Pseudomonas entomophila TaxID=312306 RepID=UPI002404CE2E|nr:hypothetical protein [Pseudomonas entomophila]MDF9619712.1 hypothetical protein [Pseudomonas entomophila]